MLSHKQSQSQITMYGGSLLYIQKLDQIEHLQFNFRWLHFIHCQTLWQSDCSVWWSMRLDQVWRTVFISVEVEIGLQTRSTLPRRQNLLGKRRTACLMKQTNRHWSSWSWNECRTERLWRDSSRRWCWCLDCKGSHQYFCFQADHPCWGRHRFSCTLAVSCSGVQCSYLYFHSDKVESNVYNIKVLKLVLGEAVCKDLLFLYAFTGCDSVSRVFGIGKKSAFQRIIKNKKAMKDW